MKRSPSIRPGEIGIGPRKQKPLCDVGVLPLNGPKERSRGAFSGAIDLGAPLDQEFNDSRLPSRRGNAKGGDRMGAPGIHSGAPGK